MTEFARRIVMTVVGVTVMGLSVGLFSFSEMGLDPFQVFAHGTWNLTRLDFGTYYVILNAIMLVLVFIFNKRKIGLGTVINLFLIGYISEWSESVLRRLIPNPNFGIRLLILILGIVIMCLSSALYYTADMGVSTYDAVAITIDERITGRKEKEGTAGDGAVDSGKDGAAGTAGDGAAGAAGTAGDGPVCAGRPDAFAADGDDTAGDTAGSAQRRGDSKRFKYIRIACDLVCVLIGWLLGATVGIGTIITAFFMGPLISFFRRTVSEPMRYGKNNSGRH